MSTLIPKSEMTEEDIKLNFITPSIMKDGSGWNDKITMETQVKFTDGKINLQGNVVSRQKPKKADYILYINANNPIAIIEAKDNNHSASYGLQQAMTYAKMLDIPFAYSSNGDSFFEHDFLTGVEREFSMEEFPSYEELVNRFKKESNNGQGLNALEEKLLDEPYYSSNSTYPPRYYQRVAINKTINAIAKGQNRILLVMATGTGKTYTAFQICYRLLQSGMKKKILYLADRNILVDQSIQQDFAPLSKVIHKVNFSKDNKDTISSYEVYFSLYQQLSEKGDIEQEENDEETVSRLASLFSPDFFDLIIVDECHRGSAKKDSNWKKILEYFSSATQIGMTATPKETKYVSNIDYFGEPVFTYSLRNGIEDGFLAPFRVISIKTDISDGWRPRIGQLDYYKNPIEDRIYNNCDFDYKIILEDRIYQVAKEITEYLKQTGRMQKTIVFCATEDAAERMRIALVNLNKDIVKDNPDYVVRITGSDEYGKNKLSYFISVSSQYPVIATTSKLLSTGADCKMTKLIVIDQMINSMTEFKQIIGRGTRIREKEGKTFFTIMDFRGVTRLFADPDWDGPIEMDDEFQPRDKKRSKDNEKKEQIIKPFVTKDGCEVSITNKIVSVYDTNGKLLKSENIIDYTRTNLLNDYASLEDFINKWSSEDKKATIKELLYRQGIDLDEMKKDQSMEDVDDFDFICHVAYDRKPLTRKERAQNVEKTDFFSKYSGAAKQVLEILLDKYMNSGIYEIESTDVLKLDPLKQFGTPSKIVSLFGGKNEYFAAVRALENQIYRNIGA